MTKLGAVEVEIEAEAADKIQAKAKQPLLTPPMRLALERLPLV
ncbi:hypothetical protein [Laspinema olomoucense]